MKTLIILIAMIHLNAFAQNNTPVTPNNNVVNADATTENKTVSSQEEIAAFSRLNPGLTVAGDSINGYEITASRKIKRGSYEMINIPSIPFFDYYGRSYVGSIIVETKGRGEIAVLADDTQVGTIECGRRLKTTRFTVNRPTAKLTFQWIRGPRVKIGKILFLPLGLNRMSRYPMQSPIGIPPVACDPIGAACGPGSYIDPYCTGTLPSPNNLHLATNRMVCILEIAKTMLNYDDQGVIVSAAVIAIELQAMLIARTGLTEVQAKLAELITAVNTDSFQKLLVGFSQRNDARAQQIAKGIRYSIQEMRRSQ